MYLYHSGRTGACIVVQAHTQMISTGGSILFEKLYSIANLQIEVRYAPPTKRDIIHL